MKKAGEKQELLEHNGSSQGNDFKDSILQRAAGEKKKAMT